MRTVPGSFRLPPVDVMSVREQLERDADSTGGRHRGQPPDGFARSLDLPVEICRLARSFSGQAARSHPSQAPNRRRISSSLRYWIICARRLRKSVDV